MHHSYLRPILLLLLVPAAFVSGVFYRDHVSFNNLPSELQQMTTQLFCPQSPPSSSLIPTPSSKPVALVTKTPTPKPAVSASFTGPQLFEAINQRRRQYGVNALAQSDDLCSLASYRLNQLLPLGTIDNHAGFIALSNDPNSAFARVFRQYNVAEFLVFISPGTAQQAVDGWDNTLGHRKLLTGGEFTIGCAYAQQGIGVAIAGY